MLSSLNSSMQVSLKKDFHMPAPHQSVLHMEVSGVFPNFFTNLQIQQTMANPRCVSSSDSAPGLWLTDQTQTSMRSNTTSANMQEAKLLSPSRIRSNAMVFQPSSHKSSSVPLGMWPHSFCGLTLPTGTFRLPTDYHCNTLAHKYADWA